VTGGTTVEPVHRAQPITVTVFAVDEFLESHELITTWYEHHFVEAYAFPFTVDPSEQIPVTMKASKRTGRIKVFTGCVFREYFTQIGNTVDMNERGHTGENCVVI
jgi:hypothetical protein